MQEQTKEKGAVKIPYEVFEGLEAVRSSGLTNMFDRRVVIEIAETMGFDETVEWIRENRDLYAHGIFRGFEEEE